MKNSNLAALVGLLAIVAVDVIGVLVSSSANVWWSVYGGVIILIALGMTLWNLVRSRPEYCDYDNEEETIWDACRPWVISSAVVLLLVVGRVHAASWPKMLGIAFGGMVLYWVLLYLCHAVLEDLVATTSGDAVSANRP